MMTLKYVNIVGIPNGYSCSRRVPVLKKLHAHTHCVCCCCRKSIICLFLRNQFRNTKSKGINSWNESHLYINLNYYYYQRVLKATDSNLWGLKRRSDSCFYLYLSACLPPSVAPVALHLMWILMEWTFSWHRSKHWCD